MNPYDIDVKTFVIEGRMVHFDHYRDGLLWYHTDTTEKFPVGFLFPVPIQDAGAAAFMASDKALLFMRYLRKHIANLRVAWDEQHDRAQR